MRAPGRTKNAATAIAMTSHAISALRPYGLKTGDGIASRSWTTPRTRASTRVQPTRVDNPTSGGFGVGRQMAARAANLNTDHTLATPFPEQDRPPEAPAATVYPPGRSASRHDGRAPWSARTQGWPPKMTVMGRTGPPGRAASPRANRSRMRPLMKWKRMTHDVSGCDRPPIDSGAHDHKISWVRKIARPRTSDARDKTEREARCPRVTQAARTAAALFGLRRSGRLRERQRRERPIGPHQ